MKKETRNCKSCLFFDSINKKCKNNSSEHRNCVIGINKEYINLLKETSKEVKVLEIGCGSWSYLKENLPQNCKWYGIDPLVIKDNKKSIATKRGSVGNIPYPNNTFDYVFSTQSIEHWHEFGVTFELAFSEISRVLKVGGKGFFNSAFYYHGHKYFVNGDVKKIKSKINHKYWKLNKITRWNNENYLQEDKKLWRFHYILCSMFDLRNGPNSYAVDIEITKKKDYSLSLYDRFVSKMNLLYAKIVPFNIRMLFHYGIINLIKYFLFILKYRKLKYSR